MSTIGKKNFSAEIVVDSNMKSHKNDPTVLAKLEQARANVKKYGLPKDEGKKKS